MNKLRPHLSEETCAQMDLALAQLSLQPSPKPKEILASYLGIRTYTGVLPPAPPAATPAQKAAIFVSYIQNARRTGMLKTVDFQDMEGLEIELKELGAWDLLMGLKADLDQVKPIP